MDNVELLIRHSNKIVTTTTTACVYILCLKGPMQVGVSIVQNFVFCGVPN